MNNNIENVLEVEIKKIDDDYSYARITYQNYDILKRGEFHDGLIKVESYNQFYLGKNDNVLFINGRYEIYDHTPIIIKNEFIPIIEEKVKLINCKYGIKKKWRAEHGERYYFIDTLGDVMSDMDTRYVLDNKKFEIGNYFKTKEDAMNSKLYKAFKGLCENEEK